MYDIYTVKDNDDIFSIAKRFNTRPEILIRLNGNSIDNLVPGTLIIVPKIVNPYFDYYTIETGDSLYQIAKDYNVDYKILAALNGLEVADYIYPGEVIMVPKEDTKYYITKENDTIASVINTLDTNIQDLLTTNGMLYLMPDQLIIKNKL